LSGYYQRESQMESPNQALHLTAGACRLSLTTAHACPRRR